MKTIQYLLMLCLLTACASDNGFPTAGSSNGTTSLAAPPMVGSVGPGIPLEVGDYWRYSRTIYIHDNATQEQSPEGLGYLVERDIAGEEDLSGVTYKVEREHQTALWHPGEWVTCTLYRQDRSGLYLNDSGYGPCDELAAVTGGAAREATQFTAGGGLARPAVMAREAARVMPDRLKSRSGSESLGRILARRDRAIQSLNAHPSSSPTAAGPGGPEAGDVPALQYPLHRGASWIMRPENEPFLIVRTVEAREILDLPAGRLAAWRIDHFIEFNEPDDSIKFWYGQAGMLKLTLHFEDITTDVYGRVTTMIWDEVMELESFVPGDG